jgi:hypothetical protein
MERLENAIMPWVSYAMVVAFYAADLLVPFTGAMHYLVCIIAIIHVVVAIVAGCTVLWNVRNNATSPGLFGVVVNFIPGGVLLMGDWFWIGVALLLISGSVLLVRFTASNRSEF